MGDASHYHDRVELDSTPMVKAPFIVVILHEACQVFQQETSVCAKLVSVCNCRTNFPVVQLCTGDHSKTFLARDWGLGGGGGVNKKISKIYSQQKLVLNDHFLGPSLLHIH